MTRPSAASEIGFTLLETLIAFAVLSVSLVMVYQIFTDGFRAKRQTAIVQTCLEHAEDIQDKLQIEARRLGYVQSQSGEFTDGFVWMVTGGRPVLRSGQFSLLSYRISVSAPAGEGSVNLVNHISVGTNANLQ